MKKASFSREIYFILIALLFCCGATSGQFIQNGIGSLTPDCSFRGHQNSGRIGYYLSEAGDVNADGYDDFMIAAYHISLHGWNSGAVFLFLGGEDKWGLNIPVESADAIFRGKKEFEMVGYHIEGGGDFNGDGFDDLLIGAPGNWESDPGFPGKAYIVFGGKNRSWGKDFILEDQADQVFVGETNYDQFGYAVAYAGDLNNDGCDDILCGAAFRNDLDQWSGKVYLIFGSREVDRREMAASDVAAASFVYDSFKGKLGSSVSGVGDVNQDGYPDFMMGAPGVGTSFLLFGNAQLNWGQDFDLNHADCIFTAENKRDDAGWQIKPAGDVNNDGFPDILISGLEILYDSGKTYVIFGKRNWDESVVSLANADASYIGQGAKNHAGVSINGVHDFNGDGFDDFLIGARYYGNIPQNLDIGKAYLIYGKSAGWRRNVDLAEIDTYYIGEDTVSCAGWGVSYAGDVNGDFRDDFLISAPFNSQSGNWAGKVYLFLGDHDLHTISGRIYYHSNNHGIQNVQLKLNEHQNTVITGANGNYLFNQPDANPINIKPLKQQNSDIGNHSITIYDAALAAFRENELNEFSRIAADVNLDGIIDFNDAQLIAFYSISLTYSNDSRVGEWVFVPEMREYNLSELPKKDEDYAGVLLGEVSGNWRAPDYEPVLHKKRVSDIQYGKHDLLEIPFVWENSMPFPVAEISIKYDPDIIRFSRISKTEQAEKIHLFRNARSPGILRIALMGDQAVAANSNLLNFYFRKIKDVPSMQMILEKYESKESVMWKYEITADNELSNRASDFQLKENYPNPFNANTTIEYSLSKPSEIELKVYNIFGNEIKKIHIGRQEIGTHRFIWNGKDNLGNNASSGLYIIRMESSNGIQTTKAILLK